MGISKNSLHEERSDDAADAMKAPEGVLSHYEGG